MFDKVIMIIMLVYLLFGIYRILRGPTFWDRLLGFAVFSSKIIIVALLIGLVMGKTYMIDIAIVYSLLGFIGTIVISRFVKKKGDI